MGCGDFWFGFEGEGEFPSEILLSVRMSRCLESWLCKYNTQHYNTSTPESPLFQEALSPVDCNSFHHLKEF